MLRLGRATLSISSSRAYWDSYDVGLTVMEFKIVQMLVSNAGSFITYRQIYDCIHRVGFVAGSGEHGYRTNVRSAVRRIREKFSARCGDFDPDPNLPVLGYCLPEIRIGSNLCELAFRSNRVPRLRLRYIVAVAGFSELVETQRASSIDLVTAVVEERA